MNRLTRLTCMVPIIVALSGCAARPAMSVLDEEAAVYAAVLEQVLNRSYSLHVPVVNITANYADRLTAGSGLPVQLKLQDETKRAFAKANQSRRRIDHIPATRPIVLIAESDTSGNGRTVFSRVGFHGDEALVHVLHICGGRCGHASYMVLGRSSSGWRVRTTIATVLF